MINLIRTIGRIASTAALAAALLPGAAIGQKVLNDAVGFVEGA